MSWHRNDEREGLLFVELDPLAGGDQTHEEEEQQHGAPAIPRPPAGPRQRRRPNGGMGGIGGIGGATGGIGGAAGGGGASGSPDPRRRRRRRRRRLPPPDEDGHERDAAATEDAHADPMDHYRDRLARHHASAPAEAEREHAEAEHRPCDGVDLCRVARLIRTNERSDRRAAEAEEAAAFAKHRARPIIAAHMSAAIVSPSSSV